MGLMRDSFVFFRSFYEATKELPEVLFKEIITAFIEYALNGEYPENMSATCKSFLVLAKPNIDNTHARYAASVENGKKGGNPNFKKGQKNPYYGYEKDNPKITQEITKDNLDSKTDNPVHNLNVDVDVDVDDNVDVNVLPSGSSAPAPAREETKLYGDFKNIPLTDKEYKNICNNYDAKEVKIAITQMSCFIRKKNRSYPDPAARLVRWIVDNQSEPPANGEKSNENPSAIVRRKYSSEELNALIDNIDDVDF